jgi:ribonuclease HI
MVIRIYSDGASRGNPGLSAIAFLILSEEETVLMRSAKYVGVRTNNQAEYEALISALEAASTLHRKAVICYLDSELVTKQLNGQYRVRNAQLKIQRFHNILITHVARTNRYIQEVDQLANRVLDTLDHRL